MDLLEGKKYNVGFEKPLADRLRPRDFNEFVGQGKLIGEGSFLRRLIDTDHLYSMILWGPPGAGKTTLAHIIAKKTSSAFMTLSAVTSGVKDVRQVIEQAKLNLTKDRRTILFIDEVHRFNRIQQDVFLPHVENGTLILIGATTENPSFSIISPLLSRCRVFVLERLNDEHLKTIISRALKNETVGFGTKSINVDEGVVDLIIYLSDGDARRALNILEMVVYSIESVGGETIDVTQDVVKEVAQRYHLVYDKSGEEHFNQISAFHKSLRGSDPDGAIYWLGRMIEAGEDPLYVARRMIRFASEDIGNADPDALVIAVAAKDTYESLGSPEGELSLAQATIYLATAPKSNAIYVAFNRVKEEIDRSGSLPVPFSLRNAPTQLMKGLGYSKGYKYDHDFKNAFSGQEYLPEKIQNMKFYIPREVGFEREIKKRLDWWKKQKEKSKGNESE